MQKLTNTVAAIFVAAAIFAPLFLSAVELKVVPFDGLMPFTDCAVIEEADFGYLGRVRGCVGWSFQIANSNPYIVIVRTLHPK